MERSERLEDWLVRRDRAQVPAWWLEAGLPAEGYAAALREDREVGRQIVTLRHPSYGGRRVG